MRQGSSALHVSEGPVLTFVSQRMRHLCDRASAQIRAFSGVVSAASDEQTAGLKRQLECVARKMLSLSTYISSLSHLERPEQESGAMALLRDAELELEKVEQLINKMRLTGAQ